MAYSQGVDPSRSAHSRADYEMHSLHSAPSSQENLGQSTDRAPIRRHETTRFPPKFIWRLAVGLVWIAPMILLLWLNLNEHVIGGAAWCPKKTCGVIIYDVESYVTTNSLIAKYEQQNHNLLGALQFAAKFLEVWFVYIATSLVYLVTYVIAKRLGGIPTGHFLTYLEYGDLRSLFDLVLYRAPRVARGQTIPRNRIHTRHLYVVPVLAASMCIVANLMGPSVAVLLLPTLHWKPTQHVSEAYFKRLHADNPPAGDSIPRCTAQELNERNYACFENHHRYDLDSLIVTNALEMNKIYDENPTAELLRLLPNSPVLYEGTMPFIFNTTLQKSSKDDYTTNASNPTLWALNRQVLRLLSKDFEELVKVIRGDGVTDPSSIERYRHCNSSRSFKLQRHGPIIGMQSIAAIGFLNTSVFDNDPNMFCYSDLEYPTTVPCFRSGKPANMTSAIASFVIDAGRNQDLLPIKVRAYWSNYNAVFTFGQNVSVADESTQDYLVMEFSQPAPPSQNYSIVVAFNISYGFATYTFDATTIFPNLNNVEVSKPPDIESNEIIPTVFDPAWVLAAWGVNDGGNVNPNRSATIQFQTSANRVLNNSLDYQDWDDFGGAVQYTFLQAASLVTFSSDRVNSSGKLPDSDKRRVLWTNTNREIWGWGIQGRTSYLGIAVGILGILTALARTMVLFKTRERERDSTELIGAALQHKYDGEFGDTVDHKVVARVRYQVGEEWGTGKLKFVPA